MKPSLVRSGSKSRSRAAARAPRQLGGVLLDRRLERGEDRRAAARVRELLGEPVDLLAQEPDGGLPVQGERARERLGPDLRVPVHVRPGPRTERQLAPAHRRLEAALELVETSGTASCSVASKKNRLRRTSSSTIGRCGDLVGLPPDRDRLAQLGLERAAARAADPRVVELVEQAGEVELVVEHGAARRLRRMRGEHGSTCSEAALRRGRGPPRAAARQPPSATRLARAGRVVVPAAADALALFRDVGELELERAGADARLDVVRGQAAHQPGERGVGVRGRRRAARRRSRASAAPCRRSAHRTARRARRGGPRRAARSRARARRRRPARWWWGAIDIGGSRVCQRPRVA